ncbi:MAG: MraY family glycosyltransferase [Aequorivita sp.]
MEYFINLFSHSYFLGAFALAAAFCLSIMIYPAIIALVLSKNIMDVPGGRSSHVKEIPTLGGIGIFIAFTVSIMILASLSGLAEPGLEQLLVLLAAISILFFLGVKDDLIGLSPKKKFIGQTFAAVLVVIISDIRIHSFEGLFGVGELPYIISVFLTILVFIFIVNAFNLIDGIDGLAGAIAVISSATFSVFFFLNEQFLSLLISLILIGAIIGFLRFNLSEKHKLFMGDSGSLFIGFLLAYQAISFIVNQQAGLSNFEVSNAPILALAILSFPILDTLRVFIIRISQKRSPFRGDRNHIHHRLLGLGFSHKQAALLVAIGNVLIIGLVFLISDLNINTQFGIVVIATLLVAFFPFAVTLRKGKIKLNLPIFALHIE